LFSRRLNYSSEIGLASIKRSAENYLEGRLRTALERHHGLNTDSAFWGWNRVWLDPAFRSQNIKASLPPITVPVFVIQGEEDEYGTLWQVEAIQHGCGAPLRSVILSGSGQMCRKSTIPRDSSFLGPEGWT
jgi:pimeloyl-ACP methyl ester carboxylesterase